MTNHPMLHYKPGLMMDEPIAVTMAAADWGIFLSWVSAKNTDGVNHIVYHVIAKQLSEALYTPASLQAAKAQAAERVENPPIVQTLRAMGVPIAGFPEADDFRQPTIFTDSEEIWILECAECHSRDEYPPWYNDTLTCGHDGMRQVIEIKSRPKNQ